MSVARTVVARASSSSWSRTGSSSRRAGRTATSPASRPTRRTACTSSTAASTRSSSTTATGKFLGSWGEGVFTRPHGITIHDDVVYCADDTDHTVRELTLDGKLLLTLGTLEPAQRHRLLARRSTAT